VRVTATPDLTIKVSGRTKVLTFDFSPKAPNKKIMSVMSQGLYQAAAARQVVTGTSDVVYLGRRARGGTPRGACGQPAHQ
jgi:hypothetical protein